MNARTLSRVFSLIALAGRLRSRTAGGAVTWAPRTTYRLCLTVPPHVRRDGG